MFCSYTIKMKSEKDTEFLKKEEYKVKQLILASLLMIKEYSLWVHLST